MKVYHKEIKSLVKSFAYAFRGFLFCLKNERNMRIHVVMATLVLLFSFYYDLSRIEYAVLLLILGMVMVCELFNTSIEALVNLGSPSYDSLARIAKDVAAGAVFMCAIAAVGVGIMIFGNLQRLKEAFLKILLSPLAILLFLAVITFGLIFIFKGISHLHLKSNSFMHHPEEEVKIYSPPKRKSGLQKFPQNETPGSHPSVVTQNYGEKSKDDVKIYKGGKHL